MIPQNEAVDISFSEKLVLRSFEITWGQNSRKKGQIPFFFNSGRIIPKN